MLFNDAREEISFRLVARVLYMHRPTDRIGHNMAFVTPVAEHWLEREKAQ